MKNPEAGEIREEDNGTTIVSLKTKDGIVVASDTRATSFIYTSKKDTNKILPIHKNAVITMAGVVGHAQSMADELKYEASKYESERGYEMPINSISHVARSLFKESHYHIAPIVAGYDDEYKIYSLGAAGSIMEYDKYTSSGSGYPFALSVLDQQYDVDMSLEDGKKLAKNAIGAAQERDNMTGNGFILCTITKENGHTINKYEDFPDEL